MIRGKIKRQFQVRRTPPEAPEPSSLFLSSHLHVCISNMYLGPRTSSRLPQQQEAPKVWHGRRLSPPLQCKSSVTDDKARHTVFVRGDRAFQHPTSSSFQAKAATPGATHSRVCGDRAIDQCDDRGW